MITFVYAEKGIGAKHNIKIINAIIPKIFLFVSSGENSFNGGLCWVPIKNRTMNASINQPV